MRTMPKVRLRSKDEIEAEIRQEREKIQALQVSLVEWRTTIDELEKGTEAQGHVPVPPSSEPGGAWNTRYENQVQYNEKLQKELSDLRVKIEHERGRLKTLTEGGELEEFKGANAQRTLIRLKREKQDLESQLRDYQWRLDQEAQSFFKVDEKRKALLKDIAKGDTRKKNDRANSKEAKGKNNGRTSYLRLQKEKKRVNIAASGGRVKLPPIKLPAVNEGRMRK